MSTKPIFAISLLILFVLSTAEPTKATVYHNKNFPLIKGGRGGFGTSLPFSHYSTNLKFRKRVPYSDNGVLALNSAGKRKQKMPPRKMIEKPKLRFKGKGKGQMTNYNRISL